MDAQHFEVMSLHCRKHTDHTSSAKERNFQDLAAMPVAAAGIAHSESYYRPFAVALHRKDHRTCEVV